MKTYGSAWSKAKSAFFHHFLLIAAILLIVASVFYPTPLDQQTLLQNVFGVSPPMSMDVPTIFVWLFLIVFIIILADSFFINQKAYHSDYVFANGINTNISCAGASLSKVGDWCYIQGERAKNFPIGGYRLVGNPPTHTHEIGSHIVMEGHCIPKTPLSYLPNDMKSAGRAMRGGLLGVTECCIGYLSDFELSKFKHYDKKDYESIKKELDSESKMSVAPLIEINRDKNRALDMKFQFANHEHKDLSAFLKNVGEVKNAINESQNKTLWDKLLGK